MIVSGHTPSAGVPSWAQVRTIRPAAGFPKPITQNLTEQALRARGVAEPDIAATIGNPERMKQLIYQTFGAGSAKAQAATDDLWSGRRPAAPIPMVPQQHSEGDRLPAGLPSWASAPGGIPFAAAPAGVRGVPGEEHPTPPETPGYAPRAADGAHAPSWGDIYSDAWRSLVSGLEQGGITLAGSPGDIAAVAPVFANIVGHKLGLDPTKHAFPAMTDYLGSKLGIDPDTTNRFKNGVSKLADWIPTSDDIRSKVENVTGPLYQPTTDTGHVLHTIGEYAPALVGGADTLVAKFAPKLAERLATRVLAPALGSEAAGSLTKGTRFEPAARLGAAMTVGGGLTALTRERGRGLPLNALGALNDPLLARAPLGWFPSVPWLNPFNPTIAGLKVGGQSGRIEYRNQPQRDRIPGQSLQSDDTE
jgi:hypothetical protein